MDRKEKWAFDRILARATLEIEVDDEFTLVAISHLKQLMEEIYDIIVEFDEFADLRSPTWIWKHKIQEEVDADS